MELYFKKELLLEGIYSAFQQEKSIESVPFISSDYPHTLELSSVLPLSRTVLPVMFFLLSTFGLVYLLFVYRAFVYFVCGYTLLFVMSPLFGGLDGVELFLNEKFILPHQMTKEAHNDIKNYHSI